MHLPEVRQKIKSLLDRAARNAAGLVFPGLCIVCRNPCSDKNHWLCARCASHLVQNHERRDACPLCGQNRRARPCACEYAWDFPFERIYSLFDYDDTVKELSHAFKYGGFKRLAFDIGKIYGELIPRDFFNGTDIAVPVPLHFLRKLRRGYNQAEYFCRGVLASSAGHPVLCIQALTRRKATRTQTALSKEQRSRNLAAAFQVPPGKARLIKGKTIALVDDVVTTGATTAQCAAILLDAGAKAVRVLSLARG
ncbi:MAG TPA: ComF family protein [Chitinivibrionales bacterium]|nr:ComF family protein [Chitinivibrionales bacterium]